VKVLWFAGEAQEPERTLEFSDFERHDGNWFVKTVQLRGEDWKTRITFSEAAMAAVADRPQPATLFRESPAAPAAPEG